MSDNVRTMPGVRPPDYGAPDTALIALLESLLADAKKGRLRSLIGTGWSAEGMRYAIWHDTHPDVYQMLGAIAWLEHEYVARKTGKVD